MTAVAAPTALLKVVVTDPVIAGFAEAFAAPGRRVVVIPGESDEAIADELRDADAVVCSRLTPASTASATRLRLVHVTGAGLDRLAPGSVPAGAAVCNTGHHGTAIAEHVLMAALLLRRRAAEADAALRAGRWESVMTRPDVPFHRMLAGDTIGIAGAGEIGTAVARLAQAFGMRVVFLRRDPTRPAPDDLAAATIVGEEGRDAFFAASDVLVLTVPLTDDTRGMVGAHELSLLPAEAIVVNVARGPLIDLDALADALDAGRLGGAAIDVWWDAPTDATAPPSVDRLAASRRTLLTPHHSGHAREVFAARAADIAANLDRLAAGAPLERRVR